MMPIKRIKQLFLVLCLLLSFACKKVYVYGPELLKTDGNESPRPFSAEIITLTDRSAKISWSEAIDPDYDEVTYKIDLNGVSYRTGLKTPGLTIEGLNPDTQYQITITASDGTNQTPASLTFKTRDGFEKFIIPISFRGMAYQNMDMILMPDGGAIISGLFQQPVYLGYFVAVIYRVNAQGVIGWSKYYDIGSNISIFNPIRLSNGRDNSFFFSAGLIAYKISAIDGAIAWKHDLGDVLKGQISALTGLVSGDVLVADQSRSLTRIGPSGSVIWEKTIPAGIASGIIENADGSFIVGGGTNKDGQNYFLARLDEHGNNIWEKPFNTGMAGETLFHNIRLTADDNTIGVFGRSLSTTRTTYFRFNKDGNLLTQNFRVDFSSLNDVIQTADGYVAVGSENGLPKIIKLNQNFDPLVNNTFSGLSDNQIMGVVELPGGGFLSMINSGIMKLGRGGNYE